MGSISVGFDPTQAGLPRPVDPFYAVDVKTTVEVEDSLLGEAKRFAASRGVRLDGLIDRAIRSLIRTQGSAIPFQLRKHSFPGDGLVTEFNWPMIRDRIYHGRGA